MPLDWPADTCNSTAQHIQEPERMCPLRFSPVPAYDWLTIHGDRLGPGPIAIVDALGRLVLRSTWRNEPLDVRDLPSGTYQLTLCDASDRPVATGRFLKQ